MKFVIGEFCFWNFVVLDNVYQSVERLLLWYQNGVMTPASFVLASHSCHCSWVTLLVQKRTELPAFTVWQWTKGNKVQITPVTQVSAQTGWPKISLKIWPQFSFVFQTLWWKRRIILLHPIGILWGFLNIYVKVIEKNFKKETI